MTGTPVPAVCRLCSTPHMDEIACPNIHTECLDCCGCSGH
jgi:hypothetical protein